MKCVGINSSGELGQGDMLKRGVTPSTTLDKIPAIDLGLEMSLEVSSIRSSYAGICVTLKNNGVKCFGSNNQGDLGSGSSANIGDEANEMGNNLPYVDIFATLSPTLPTLNPTLRPTRKPSSTPTLSPTSTPTMNPSTNPTANPTSNPSNAPSISPTITPSSNPTFKPTTTKPTALPTQLKSSASKNNQSLAIGLGVSMPLVMLAVGGVLLFKYNSKMGNVSKQEHQMTVASNS